MRKVKCVITTLLMTGAIVLTTGCGDFRSAIFKEEEQPESTVSVKYDQLEGGTYYVKQGTNFYKLYEPENNFSGEATTADPTRLFWNLATEDDLIPTLYKDEPIVYSVDADVPQELTMERFKDLGFSIGVSSLEVNDNGMYEVAGKADMRPDSDAIKELAITNEDGEPQDLGIAFDTVSNKKLDESNISSSGTITGLKKNKTYQAGVYVGAKYKDVKIKADTHIYQSSETLILTQLDMTKNGYMAADMPKDLQSGFYYLADAGVFRYINKPRGKSEKDIDYNRPNEIVDSRAVDDTVSESDKEFPYQVEKDVDGLTISLDYDSEEAEIETAYLRLPSGDKREIEDVTLELDEEVKAGTYTVYIKGKNIDRITVNFDEGEPIEEEPEEKEEKPKEKTKNNETNKQTNTQQNTSTPATQPRTTNRTNQQKNKTVYDRVPVTEPLNKPEISGTIGD